MTFDNSKISTSWKIPSDNFLRSVKSNWFSQPQKQYQTNEVIGMLNEWFQSTKINNLIGWNSMPYIDITMGCAHYIESFIIGQQSLDNFQTLPDEYAYYSFLGKWGTPVGELDPNKPLIIT